MKKLVAMFLVMSMLGSVTACGKKSSDNESTVAETTTESPAESSTVEESTEKSTEETTEEVTESSSVEETTEEVTESSSVEETTEEVTESSSIEETTEEVTESSSIKETTDSEYNYEHTAGLWRLDGEMDSSSIEMDGAGGFTMYYASGSIEAMGYILCVEEDDDLRYDMYSTDDVLICSFYFDSENQIHMAHNENLIYILEKQENRFYEIAQARKEYDIVTAQDIINTSLTDYSTETYDFQGYGNAYEQCNDDVKKLYDDIKSKIDNLEYFCYSIEDGYTYDDLDNVYNACVAISSDNPYYEIYFRLKEVLNESGEMTIALESGYFMPGMSDEEIEFSIDEIKEELAIFDAECQLIIDGMDESWSTYDKYRYLAVVISLATSYDYEFGAGIESGNGYAAINGGLAICAGYSVGMQILCQRANLYCEVVSGDCSGTAHAWNLVQLDSGTYYVDITWSDEAEDIGVKTWCEYFMFTEEKAAESRIIWDDVVATGTEVFECE